MLRRSPRALLLWSAAAVIAIATATFVAHDLAAIHRRAQTLGVEHTVVVATRDLSIGTRVSSAALATRRVHDDVPPGARRRSADVIGRIVVTPVLRGEVVTARHLAAARRQGLDGVVPRGMRAVRVVIDDGLRPSPGQSIDVLATYDPSKVAPSNDPTVTVVAAATVVAVDEPDGSSSPDGSPASVSASRRIGVTLLTTPEQARRLAFARANGVLTLDLVPPEEQAGRR